MKLIYLNKVDSTHTYLKEYIKNNNIKESICFYTFNQTNGLGSRNNKWQGEEGNLFFSFAILQNNLPIDLPIQSASIYFSHILKDTLAKNKSNLFLKWPNDFYIEENKIGGTITNKIQDYFLCGIGLNLKKTNHFDGYLDIDIKPEYLLEIYFDTLETYPSWKQIFSKFKLEFHNSKNFMVSTNDKKVSLENAILNDDGSLNINDEKVFSLR